MENQQQELYEQEKPQNSYVLEILSFCRIVGAVVVIMGAIAALTFAWLMIAPPPGPAHAAAPEPQLQVGMQTVLTGSGSILVAVGPGVCDEIDTLRAAGDHIGLQRLVDQDLVRVPDEGTHVLVIDTGGLDDWVRIRLESGRHAGEDGWVRRYQVAVR